MWQQIFSIETPWYLVSLKQYVSLGDPKVYDHVVCDHNNFFNEIWHIIC